jgi:predicted nuclease of predicted toxin-antitoxin system
VRVLIDACLPVELKTLLEGAEVKTARDMGWQRLDNGQLLKKAEGQFDVLVTMDKAMPSQQILARHSIALVIIKARSNRVADLKPLLPAIQAAIVHGARGMATRVP